MFLQNMREKTQSWVAYVIVGLLILSFALWGISSYFGSSATKPPVATVGGEKITYANFITAYQRFLQDSEAQNNTSLKPAQEQYAKRLVLKGLVERVAIIQYITKFGFAVNQQQVDAALMAVPLFSADGQFSPGLFKRFLMANNISAQQFIEDFATRMKVAQWNEGISMTSFSTPFELGNIISLLKQKRSIIYGVIKASEKGLLPIASADAEHYYHDHQQSFVNPEQVKIAYVTLRLSDLVKNINPTNEELIKYYTQNSARYNVPEEWQVDVISADSSAAALLPGAKIEQKAVWLTANNLSPEIKMALANTALNGTTAAFKVNEKTYIAYKLLKHKAAVNKQYYEVKSQVRSAYIDQEANKQWNQQLEEMANLSYEHPESLESLASKLKLNVQTTGFFSRDYDNKSSKGSSIESNAEVITAAFSDDVLTGGNNSDVIKLNQGKSAVVLRITDHIIAHEQSFAEVEKSIKQTLLSQAAMQRAKKSAQHVQSALDAGESIEKVQKANHLILSKQVINRFDQKIPSEILQQAFMLPVNHSGIVQINTTDFAVVQVLAVTPGKMSAVSEKERAMYENVIVNEWAQAELLAYVRSIMKNTKVKMNKEALATNT